MSDADWIPVFVMAPVSQEVIDTVLRHGQTACETDEVFINRWVLVQSPDQSTFHKPTEPLVQPFQSGFLDFSTKDLQNYVSSNFGESGLGSNGSTDWIARDAFAVIDARTAQDLSIAFWVQEKVDALEEADVRVTWNKGTALDRLLVDYNEGENLSEEDTHFLFQNLRDGSGNFIVSPGYTDLKSGTEQMNKWIEDERYGGRLTWMEVRMASTNAIACTYGIWNIGVVGSLTQAKDMYLST